MKYNLSDFPTGTIPSHTSIDVEIDRDKVKKLTEITELVGVRDEDQILAVHGFSPDRPPYEPHWKGKWPSRSEAQFRVVCAILRAGLSNEVAYSVITDPDLLISESTFRQKDGTALTTGQSHRHAVRQIRNARKKLAEEASGQKTGAMEGATGEHREPTRLISLAPFDPKEIQPRPWTVPDLLLRGAVTTVAGRGGAGKSLFGLHCAVMVALGTEFAHWKPKDGIRRTLVLNAEDDIDEMRRRLAAICHGMKVDLNDLQDRIYTHSATNLVLIEKKLDPNGSQIIKLTELGKDLVKLIRENDIKFLVIDPLVESHIGFDENSNTDMKEVVTHFRDLIAKVFKIPVLIVHHTRKGAVTEDADAIRGGGATAMASRLAFLLEFMSEKEAAAYLPADEQHERFKYVWLNDGKADYSERTGKRRWMKIISYNLGNGDSGEQSDTAPYYEKAELNVINYTPDNFERLHEFLKAVEVRVPSPTRATTPNVLDMLEEFGIPKDQTKKIYSQLLQEGTLEVKEVKTEQRNVRPKVFVKNWPAHQPTQDEIPF